MRESHEDCRLTVPQKGYNIRCNSIHPGAILTHMWDLMLEKEKSGKKHSENEFEIPLGYMGKPLDVGSRGPVSRFR